TSGERADDFAPTATLSSLAFVPRASPAFSLFSSLESTEPSSIRHRIVVSVPSLITLPSRSANPSPSATASSPSTSVPFELPTSRISHLDRPSLNSIVACRCDTASSPLIHTALPRLILPTACGLPALNANVVPSIGPATHSSVNVGVSSSSLFVSALVAALAAFRRGGIAIRLVTPTATRCESNQRIEPLRPRATPPDAPRAVAARG
ncbi:hypothetical protein BE221DRAFT_58382, partial [Ostreococcus tauri]